MYEFLSMKILIFEMYRVCTGIGMIILYTTYSRVLKNKPEKIQLVPNISLFICATYVIINILLKEFKEDVYWFIIPFIVVSIVLKIKAKHDSRANKIYKLLNEDIWNKNKLYFFPKDFSDQDLNKIEEFVGIILFKLKNEFKEELKDVFIWIKKRGESTTVRIVNMINLDDYIKEGKFIDIYESVTEDYSGAIETTKKEVTKIELNCIF